MCLNPPSIRVNTATGLQPVKVPCGLCWQCQKRRVSDYVGRALCEAAYAVSSCALTLTYAPRDDLAEQIITPAHFQKFVRSLRRRGTTLRYIVAGEYGTARGRAHFHAVLFFYENPPRWANLQRDWDDAWPHGHIFADWTVGHSAVKYPLKYIMKDESWFSISKKPAIGWQFFHEKAQALFDMGLMPQGFSYLPPDGDKDKRYYLSGSVRRDFLLRLCDLYDAAGIPLPDCPEPVAEAIDRAIQWRLYHQHGIRVQTHLEMDKLLTKSMREETYARRLAVRSAMYAGDDWLDGPETY